MKDLREWSKAVKARDLACKQCGTDQDLHAHHIKHKATHPELMLDINNGITLCYRCHKAEHERNRPVRVRSGMPQKRTIAKQLAEAEKKLESALLLIESLKEKNEKLKKELEDYPEIKAKKAGRAALVNKVAKEVLMSNGWNGFMN